MSFDDLLRTVLAPGLCTRCGLCIGACPPEVIELGRDNYPVLDGECIDCGLCTKSCPGAEVDFPSLSRHVFHSGYDVDNLQGYMEQNFIGHSTDEAIRSSGTSGGLVTALLLFLLKSGKIDGAVVAGPHDQPYIMKGVLATSAEEILNAAQSKYCLTSSMNALRGIRRSKGKFAVVGLPCQVHGLRKLMRADPSFAKKIYCIFGLYCHCNMEPYVHLDVLKSRGIKLDDVAKFSFRGGGWPGGFHVVDRKGTERALHTTLYTTILNILFKLYGASRCYLCIDALSEFADLSFGDFFAHDYSGDLAQLERCTLVSQRTEKGKELLRDAENHGAIAMHPLPADRYSKRILNMAKGKKNRNLARIKHLKKNGLQVPEYHIPLQVPGRKARRSELMLRLWFLFRGPVTRKIMLKFLFSKTAKVYETVNQYRKQMFCNYHGN